MCQPVKLDEPMRVDLDGILHSASKLLDCCEEALHEGLIQPAHATSLMNLRDDMGMLLASFEDGDAYGSICVHVREAMRCYEWDACELLDKIEMPHACP